MKPKVSLFGSSIRPHLYDAMFKSLEGTTVDFEVVFAGPKWNYGHGMIYKKSLITRQGCSHFYYHRTLNIKPTQCYEVARRECKGEVVIWIADDCEFPDDVIGKAYRFYKKNCTRKDVVCMKTKENYDGWIVCDSTKHQFFGNTPAAPKMAPIGMINRKYFQELGGIDRRYICGQWDNSLMIQVYNDGGKLHYFDEGCIKLDHTGKHEFGTAGKSPFGKGYAHDRKILEGSWGKRGQMIYSVPYKRYDAGFEAFEDREILTKSQSYNMEALFND